MTGLLHVEVEPLIAVERGGRRARAAWMEGHRHARVILASARADGDAAGHGAPHLLHTVRVTVAAEHPDDRVVLVSRADEASVRFGISLVENDVARRLRVDHPASPRRQHGVSQPCPVLQRGDQKLLLHAALPDPLMGDERVRDFGERRLNRLLVLDQRALPLGFRQPDVRLEPSGRKDRLRHLGTKFQTRLGPVNRLASCVLCPPRNPVRLICGK